jgi:hypothetical protein
LSALAISDMNRSWAVVVFAHGVDGVDEHVADARQRW